MPRVAPSVAVGVISHTVTYFLVFHSDKGIIWRFRVHSRSAFVSAFVFGNIDHARGRRQVIGLCFIFLLDAFHLFLHFDTFLFHLLPLNLHRVAGSSSGSRRKRGTLTTKRLQGGHVFFDGHGCKEGAAHMAQDVEVPLADAMHDTSINTALSFMCLYFPISISAKSNYCSYYFGKCSETRTV